MQTALYELPDVIASYPAVNCRSIVNVDGGQVQVRMLRVHVDKRRILSTELFHALSINIAENGKF
jgi:hypothetical protein